MRYPKLVPEVLCRTPVEVVIYGEGMDEEGGQLILFEDKELTCNYQESAGRSYQKDREGSQISGKAYFSHDFCPGVETISSGYVVVYGVKREISTGIKARNPDGTVNHIEIRVK